MTDTGRYTSRTLAAARFVAQQGLLRNLVWTLCDVHVHHAERLDGVRPPLIVAANHTSHLDTPLILGALPNKISGYLAAGAAQDYFFEHRWKAVGTSLFFNAFPIDRQRTGKRRGMSGQLLEAGVPLLIFPEGTRSKTLAMKNFKPGVARLAIARKVPVLPIALVGAGAAMPKDASWPVRGRPAIHVVLGTPMLPKPEERAHAFSDRLHDTIFQMHEETAGKMGMPTFSDYQKAALAARPAADESAAEEED